MRPIIWHIDEVQHDEWKAAEAAYIQFFREQGCALVNTQSGGDGFSSGPLHPKFGKATPLETRAKISASLKGNVISPEQRIKISRALKGKRQPPMTLETRAKVGAFHKGKALSKSHRRKISAASKNRTPEYRSNIRAAMLASWVRRRQPRS